MNTQMQWNAFERNLNAIEAAGWPPVTTTENQLLEVPHERCNHEQHAPRNPYAVLETAVGYAPPFQPPPRVTRRTDTVTVSHFDVIHIFQAH